MAVQINIHPLNLDPSKRPGELVAAEELKSQWENELIDANGIIDLLVSVKYPGGDTSDIDILAFLDLYQYGIFLPDGRDIDICKVALIFEVKDHPIYKIRRQGPIYEVKYNGGWKKASAQSETQKNDICNYITSTWSCKEAPFFYNFIWLHGISQADLDNLCGGSQPLNDYALPHSFSLEYLLQRLITIKPKAVDGYNIVNSFWKVEKYGGPSREDIVHHFVQMRKIDVTALTQSRLNLLSAEAAEAMICQENISKDNLTILQGRAGTGKTIKLLQYAVYLHNRGEDGQRCLLLTYNHALVADIRRLLFLCGYSTKIDQRTVQVQTLHSFFLEIMCILGTRKDKEIEDPESYFADNGGYEKDLKDLYKEVLKIRKKNLSRYVCEDIDRSIDWDYLFIDEAQDWMDIERDILFQVYGHQRIIVADGIDQFMRGYQPIDWREGVKNRSLIFSNCSLRQKTSLVTFVNAFARSMSSNWKVDANSNLIGGEVDIIRGYNSKFHTDLLAKCMKEEAVPYDILFLVPPVDVNKAGGFRNYEKFTNNGIKLFDGTIRSNRERYCVDMDSSRLYQYDSCRGLEGWCVVCYDFDLLYEYKYDKILNQLEQGLITYDGVMATNAEKAERLTCLWLLMPLTRAIHRLVITLKNPDGKFGQLLHKIQKMHEDFITWSE